MKKRILFGLIIVVIFERFKFPSRSDYGYHSQWRRNLAPRFGLRYHLDFIRDCWKFQNRIFPR